VPVVQLPGRGSDLTSGESAVQLSDLELLSSAVPHEVSTRCSSGVSDLIFVFRTAVYRRVSPQ